VYEEQGRSGPTSTIQQLANGKWETKCYILSANIAEFAPDGDVWKAPLITSRPSGSVKLISFHEN
jgi:hypothetical protein